MDIDWSKKNLEEIIKNSKATSKEELLNYLGIPCNEITMGIISGFIEKNDLISAGNKMEVSRIKVESEEEALEILLKSARMGFVVGEKQIELNRAWIHDDEDECIGETNFVVKESYLKKILPQITDDDYEDFLDVYEPETDGEKIYQIALSDNEIVEDIGEFYY